MWIISKQENLIFCCIRSEHLINYKIMYNQFTFSIYHNLYSVWCILLYWWCFLTINTFKTIMIVYFIMSVYYFIYSVDTLIHAYGNRSLHSRYLGKMDTVTITHHMGFTQTLIFYQFVMKSSYISKHIINFCLPLLCMESRLCTVDGAPETWLISFVWTLNTSLSS